MLAGFIICACYNSIYIQTQELVTNQFLVSSDPLSSASYHYLELGSELDMARSVWQRASIDTPICEEQTQPNSLNQLTRDFKNCDVEWLLSDNGFV